MTNTSPPPPPFLWMPYLFWLGIILFLILWPLVLLMFGVLVGQATTGFVSLYALFPFWMVTLPVGLIILVVWLVRVTSHYRADQAWLKAHP